jgi:hypothetical protein
MADMLDLGSLLPMGYAAPDVQGILGGEQFIAICDPSGSTPTSQCQNPGSKPGAGCLNPGGNP